MTISLDRLQSSLAKFPQLTIGLVGDLFLDRYLEIEPNTFEVSIETDLEAYQVTRVRNSPGALGTVMNNLVALGVERLMPVTVIGDDGHGHDLRQQIQRLGVNEAHIIGAPDRLTPTYTKPLKQNDAGAWTELNRLDVRTRAPLSENVSDSVCRHLQTAFHSADGLIVLDQINETNWGVVNDHVRDTLAELYRAHPDKLVFIDSRSHLSRFDFGTLKGNKHELIQAAGRTIDDRDGDFTAETAVRRLAQKTCQTVFCTLGDRGIMVGQPDRTCRVVPARPVDGPIDIVGAGDSATSGIVASLLSGADTIEAAEVGNLAASIAVRQLGTTGTATREQILQLRHSEREI